MVVYLLEDRELPLLKITAVIRTGSIYDPPGQEGLAELTATMMETGGIAGMTGAAVDETLESMAALLQTSVNRDYGTFSLSLLRNDLEKGLELFSRILRQPAFEQDRLTLAKGLKIEELRRIGDDPQKLAFREFGRIIYEGSPWGSVASRGSITRLQRVDLIRCHELFYNPENIMIAVSGDIGRAEAQILLNRYFGTWKSTEMKAPPPPPPPLPRARGIFFLSKEISQAICLFGWLAPSKRDVQFYPFEILDFIVGSGGFRSRIFQEIRTNRGLAYSTGSFYRARKEHGLLGAYALTKPESVLEVISLIQGIIREVGVKPVPPGELAMTKKAILNSFIFSFTSADQIALQQLLLKYNDLPDDFLASYRGKIDNVNADAIRKAAGLHLDPERAVVFIIGNEAVYRDIAKRFDRVLKIEGGHD
ncbi:MAG: hypothetical protein A2Z43_03910 [Syntrophobacterales bacterium RBG_19FT_COMBO_59_10]|nr:MAG: hypothetical protein A2Z43_03910 [Syntrophobacterales bacterium RBG_19FT_COMBO_59_10]